MSEGTWRWGIGWGEFLQALGAIKARSELFVMVIMLFQFILAHNCVGGRFPLVVITLVLNGAKFSRAGFPPPARLFESVVQWYQPPTSRGLCNVSTLWRDMAAALSRGRWPVSHAPAASSTLLGQEEGAQQLLLPSACGHPHQDMGMGTLDCAETHRVTPDPLPTPMVPMGLC